MDNMREGKYQKFETEFQTDEINQTPNASKWTNVAIGRNKWKIVAILLSIFAITVTVLAIVAFVKLQQSQKNDAEGEPKAPISSINEKYKSKEPRPNCTELFKVTKVNDFYVLSSSCECKGDNCSFAAPFGNIISTSQFIIPFESMENHSVTIKATPVSSKPWPTINFKSDSSNVIYFHISVRIDRQVVLRNVKFNDTWNASKRELQLLGDRYPFTVGREFKMVISVDTEAFHVYVDDQHIFDFNHRHRPISDIKFLTVDDKFDLKEVRFN
ncbi:galectin-5-like [Clavelina lepadiformis]|uniref:galectin-5-like n=1 Tax=Clavelina lepadiformis TaxID=159417 RepID=UPI0040417C06